MMTAYGTCQVIELNPAQRSSSLARRGVRAFPRRPPISVGMSQRENWSTSTREPPGVSTRAHSRSPACWSDQWSNDVVLTTTSKKSSGCGSRSAAPRQNRVRWSLAASAAASIMAGAGSMPTSSLACGHRRANSLSKYPVPQPTSSTRCGAAHTNTARAAVRSAMSWCRRPRQPCSYDAALSSKAATSRRGGTRGVWQALSATFVEPPQPVSLVESDSILTSRLALRCAPTSGSLAIAGPEDAGWFASWRHSELTRTASARPRAISRSTSRFLWLLLAMCDGSLRSCAHGGGRRPAPIAA